jgi:ParB family chromosome partitioning protein
MLNKKKVLGRGLGALIGDAGRAGGAGEKTGAEGRFIICPITDISPNRLQPRKSFDEAALKELSDSIKEKGVIEPVVVRKNSGGYELIAGERRWRAAKMAGFGEVPAVIADVSDEESLEFAIIENIQREDLNAIEEAEAFRSLVNFGLSQEEVAKKVGKERATVANYLRLLKLPPEVKDELAGGRISMGHARAILSIEGHAAQANLCRSIIRKGLSVREAEALAQRGSTRAPKKTRTRDAAISPLEDALREKFGTKVLVKDKGGRGRIEILYYSVEERERIIELLKA